MREEEAQQRRSVTENDSCGMGQGAHHTLVDILGEIIHPVEDPRTVVRTVLSVPVIYVKKPATGQFSAQRESATRAARWRTSHQSVHCDNGRTRMTR